MANFHPNLDEQLKESGYAMMFWSDDTQSFLEDYHDKSSATHVYFRELDGFSGNSNKLPKKKVVDFAWCMGKIKKENVFNNISDLMTELLSKNGVKKSSIECCATSFGVSVWVVMSWKGSAQKYIDMIKKMLDDAQITYSNEYSDAGWVYRFRLSKSQENLDKIEKILL